VRGSFAKGENGKQNQDDDDNDDDDDGQENFIQNGAIMRALAMHA